MAHSASKPRSRKILCAALFGAVLVAGAVPAASFAAGEVGSGGGGGGGGGTTTCSPITSLTLKADASTSDTSIGSLQISYGVKPCTNGQAVTVDVNVSEYSTGNLFVDMPNSPLNGKFTLYGIRARFTYKVTVTVYDAVTGAVAGIQSGYVATPQKRI